MQKQRMNILPHPNKILIKIPSANWNSIFSKWVRRDDGSQVELFTDIEESEGFERKFQQNVSVGAIMAVGENIRGPIKGDMAIIDYLVTGNDDALVGFINGTDKKAGDKLVCINANTVYHTEDSTPYIDGRSEYKEGDFETISPLLGYVRMGKVYACHPYVFLKHESNVRISVSGKGVMHEIIDQVIKREVIAAHPSSGFNDFDKIFIQDKELFSRFIDGKEISICFESDILGKLR